MRCEQVGLQGCPGDRGPGRRRSRRCGFECVDSGEQVGVPVEEGSVDSGFSELCKPSCKVGMSHQVTVAARLLKTRQG